jgi:HEAT repeat protein
MAEPNRRKRWKLFLLIFLAALALAGGAAYSQKNALRTWYYSYRFERAAQDERQAWADKLVETGEPAVPRLLGCLQKDDVHLCLLTRLSLEKLLASWGPADSRSLRLADRFFDVQPSFSPAGQIAALQLLPDLLSASQVETAAKARIVVSAALKDKSAERRFFAIAAGARPELNLLPSLVPLLDDPEADVRRAAMWVLGPIREGKSGTEQPMVSSDDLLRWLHDPDPNVRSVCAMSLRSRGLSDQVIRMGRMITNPDPVERLKFLLDLPDEENVDLAVWLKRLSNDPESAVRAGAARVAAEHSVDFAERLEQMSRDDSDASVRRIAEHYRKYYRQ